MAAIEVAVGIGARRTSLAGRHDGAWRIRLAARPVEGQANAELIRFVAETLGVPRSRVHITRGASSRRKRLEIDADLCAIEAAFDALSLPSTAVSLDAAPTPLPDPTPASTRSRRS